LGFWFGLEVGCQVGGGGDVVDGDDVGGGFCGGVAILVDLAITVVVEVIEAEFTDTRIDAVIGVVAFVGGAPEVAVVISTAALADGELVDEEIAGRVGRAVRIVEAGFVGVAKFE
jgi:hypothetical protein